MIFCRITLLKTLLKNITPNILKLGTLDVFIKVRACRNVVGRKMSFMDANKPNEFRNKCILTLLALVAISIIINNMILLGKCTPIGYVIDIYSQLPSIFWYGLSIVYFIGCLLILQKKRDFKKIGIIILLINYCLVLFIPYELGYFCYGRADEMSHIGEMRNIISTGYIDPINIYPAMHIIFTSVSLMCNVEPNITSLLLPTFLSILFVFGMFVFSRLFINYDKSLLSLIIPCSLVYYLGFFHFQNIPHYVFFTLVPLILFVLFKYLNSKTFSISVIFTIFVLLLPFAHPFIFILLAYLFILIALKDILSKAKTSNIYTLLTILICSFVAWVIYNVYYLKSFTLLYHIYIEMLRKPVMAKGLEKLSIISLSTTELFKFIFIYYGRYIIPLFFVAIMVFYVVKKRKSIQKDKLRNNTYMLIAILIVFGSFESFLLFNPFVCHNPIRLFDLNFVVFAMIPLFAISIYELILKKKQKWKTIIISSVILTLVFTSSMYGVFYSPYIHHSNVATTYNEVDGMNWLFNHKDEKPIYDLLGAIGYRYCDLLYGYSETEQRFNKDILWSGAGKVHDHFGYDKNKHFNETNKYVVIMTEGELLYQTVYKKVGRYNASDFEKFRSDPNVNKMYDSLNIEIYKS